MRSVGVGLLVLCAGWVVADAARADIKEDALAIIDKAIKATGGEATINKYKAMTWTEKGTYYGTGDGLPFTGKYAKQFPDKFRMDIENVFTIVVDGDKGWVQMGGDTKEMTKEQLANQKRMQYGGQVARLVTLKDKGFTFGLAKPIDIDKKPAVGVLAMKEGHGDVTLYFDKASGLLVKTQQTVKSEEMKGKEVSEEVFLSDYKAVMGLSIRSGDRKDEALKVPTKIVIKRDGKDYIVGELSDIKPAEKLDAKVFAKP